MNSTLSEKRTQPGLGAMVIFLYALYGAYIVSLFILEGDKGGLRSADFLLFVIVFLLLVLSDFRTHLITSTFEISQKSIILVFITYMALRLLIEDSDIQLEYLLNYFPEIGKYFIAGFIAFSVLKSDTPIISEITERLSSTKSMMRLTIVITLIFIVTMLYFIAKFQGTSLLNIITIIYLQNGYYQGFGDYFSLACCCLVTLQIHYFTRINPSKRSIYILMLLITVEGIIAFTCLQVVNSNKSALLTTLVSISAIILVYLKDFFIGRGIIKTVAFYIIPFFLLVWLLTSQLLMVFEVSNMRFFDYGQSRSMVENSSIESRWKLFMDYGIDQLVNAPVFGDLSIKNYQHSSVVSVQTHLGLIGSLLLWSFVIKQMSNVYRDGGNEGLKAIALPILFVSAISSFFSWGPLWFLIGALYEYEPQSSDLLHDTTKFYEVTSNHRSLSTDHLTGSSKC